MRTLKLEMEISVKKEVEEKRSMESPMEYLAQREKELMEEIEKGRRHNECIISSRDPVEDLKSYEFRKIWRKHSRLLDELLETLILHNVKVQTKEGKIVLRDVTDNIEIYYLFLHEKPIELKPRAVESLLKIQKKLNSVYGEIRDIMEREQSRM